jgi:hypothetical protein
MWGVAEWKDSRSTSVVKSEHGWDVWSRGAYEEGALKEGTKAIVL